MTYPKCDHPGWEPGCGDCAEQREGMTVELANASGEVATLLNRMGAQGVNVPFNEIVLSQRLETLIDMLLETDTKARMVLEHAAGLRVLGQLRGAQEAMSGRNGGLYVPDTFRKKTR